MLDKKLICAVRQTSKSLERRERMEKIGYRQILSQKDYCKIIIANMINRFGDSIDAIAYTYGGM